MTSVVEKIRASGVPVRVLCGGVGGEREVSLASGDTVHKALLRAGVPAGLAIVPEVGPEAFLENMEPCLAVMMLHGDFGEDGAAQRILERRGIPFTGADSASCALAMDKNAAKRMLVANGIPTPRWVTADTVDDALANAAGAALRYPLFVKPNFGGSSVGVSRADSAGDLAMISAGILESHPMVLIEEMVLGRELTVGWLDGRVLPIIELEAEGVFYDYEAKYVSENTRYVCPAPLEREVEDVVSGYAAEMVRLLNSRDLARVDVMLGDEGPKVLELNSLPGFTTHSLLPMAAVAAGMGIEELCLSLVVMAAGRAGIV